MQEEDLAIFGDGEQRTAFTYIKDIIPGIAESINNKFDLNQTFNMDADKDYSVNRLAKTVMKTMGIEVKVRYVESRKELKIAYSDHSKFNNIVLMYKETSLEEGIEIMAKWAKSVGTRKSQDFDNIEIRRNLPSVWR